MTIFAAFLVCKDIHGNMCATTRAADRGESGQIGLAGGKLDAGESGAEAALREAGEEGWYCPAQAEDLILIHTAIFDGKVIHWYSTDEVCTPLAEYKEMGRIKPITCDLETIAKSGFGNEFLLE
jgi:8-oxo-dGTP pyrophosphatase MutT (NUDIX family)